MKAGTDIDVMLRLIVSSIEDAQGRLYVLERRVTRAEMEIEELKRIPKQHAPHAYTAPLSSPSVEPLPPLPNVTCGND